MTFKIGDRVRFKMEQNTHWNNEGKMEHLKGQEAIIKNYNTSGALTLEFPSKIDRKDYNWNYFDFMVELVEEGIQREDSIEKIKKGEYCIINDETEIEVLYKQCSENSELRINRNLAKNIKNYRDGYKAFAVLPNGVFSIFRDGLNKGDVQEVKKYWENWNGQGLKEYILPKLIKTLKEDEQIIINSPDELETLYGFFKTEESKKIFHPVIQEGAYDEFVREGKHKEIKYPRYFRWLKTFNRYGISERNNGGICYNISKFIPHSYNIDGIRQYIETIPLEEKGLETIKQLENQIIVINKTLDLYKNELEKRKIENGDLIRAKNLLAEDLKKVQDELKLYKYKLPPKEIKTREKEWDNVIIGDDDYDLLNVSFKKRIPVNLEGPAGVGKSTIVRALAESNGIPFVEFNFNGDTTVEHLLGHMILIKSGGVSVMKFQDGPLVDAVRNGKVFLAHEINATSPEVQFILNGLLENKKGEYGMLSVQGNNGEVIKPHPNFRFYATSNPGYLGTKTFGGSFASRFTRIEIKPLDKQLEIDFLHKLFTYTKEIKLLVELEDVLRKNSNFTYPISTRDLIQILDLVSGGIEITRAIKVVIYTQIDLEKEILEETVKKIFK